MAKNPYRLTILFIPFLTPVLVLQWKIREVDYVFTSFATILYSSTFLTTLGILVSVALLIYTMMRKLKYDDYFSLLLAWLLYFILSFGAPYIANFPYMSHRDTYLHTSYSVLIAQTGHIPLDRERWDVYSFPLSFVFYSALSLILGENSVEKLGATMTVVYTLLLPLIVYAVVLSSCRHYACKGLILALPLLAILPYISRYAPAIGFPHRFHIAYLLMLLYIMLLIRVERSSVSFPHLVALTIVVVAIVLYHPYHVVFISIASFVYAFLELITGKNWKRSLSIFAIPLIALLIHVIYTTDPLLLVEAYRLSQKLERINIFVETSLQVPIHEHHPLAETLGVAVIWLWRISLLLPFVLAVILLLYQILSRNVDKLALSIFVASLAFSPLLIISALWWERSLSFIGTAVGITLMGLPVYAPKFSRLLSNRNIYVLIFVIFAVIILLSSSIVRHERPLLIDGYNGVEKQHLLHVITLVSSPSLSMGYHTGVELTYVKTVLGVKIKSWTLYDPVRVNLTSSPLLINAPYTITCRDPEFYLHLVDISELAKYRGIAYNSDCSYIFT